MATTDSVSVFAEGTFEDQFRELVNYIARDLLEDERTAFIRPFQDAMKTPESAKLLEEDVERCKKVISMILEKITGLGGGSDKEIEGFFNLVYSHLFALYPADAPETGAFLDSLLQTISSSPAEHASVKYRILSNLFNAIPRTSSLRLPVYNTLVQVASSNDQLDVLQITRPDVEKWISEWSISSQEKSAFLKSIVDAYAKSEQLAKSYQYSLLYVRSLPASEPASQTAAIDLVASALRLPEVYDFDPLFKLEPVIASKDHALFPLLQIFLSQGLSEYQTWAKANGPVLSQYNLESAALERKIRLLTLASLGFLSVGKDLAYAQVAASLQVDPSEVEKWVIDVIRAGLVSGKLSQTSETVHITRSTARTFEKEQWEGLEKRLVAWKAGITSVLEVVSAARKNQGSVQQAVVA